MAEKAFLYDTSHCSACKGCQVACKLWNDLPSSLDLDANEFNASYQNPPDNNGDTRMIITFSEHEPKKNSTKRIGWAFNRSACKHCTDAGCVRVCPTGAISCNEDTGLVTIDKSKCIECHYCETACPFDIPRYDHNEKIEKCDGCADRVAQGMAPACVSTCPANALHFGDRDEMIKLAHERVEVLKARGYDDACVYGEEEMGGLHVISVLKYGAEKHGEVINPKMPSVVRFSELARPIAGLGVGVTVAGLAFSFATGIGYHRDEMRYDEKTGDKINVATGAVMAHTNLETHVTEHFEGDEPGIHFGTKKGGE